MTNDFLELIVKVGKTSTLSFSNVKAYRAISSEDLTRRVNNHSNCRAVIIENIREEELNTVKELIKAFTVENERYVWFYVKDNDDITCGLADELNYEIHLSEESLFKDIFNKTGRIITSNISLRKELSDISDDGDDPFAVFEQPSNIEKSDESNIDNTEDARDIDSSQNISHEDNNETTKEQVENIEEVKLEVAENKEREDATNIDKLQREIEGLKVELNQLNEKNEQLELNKIQRENEITLLKSELNKKIEQSEIEKAQKEREISLLKSELSDTASQEEIKKLLDEISELRTEIKELSGTKEELSVLNQEHRSLSEDYSELNKKHSNLQDEHTDLSKKHSELTDELYNIKDKLESLNKEHSELTEYANNRISELNKLNTMLKGKYNDIVKQYNDFMEDTEVLEDPISLEDYREIKISLSDIKNELETAHSKVKELTETNDENTSLIEQLENEIKTQSEKITKYKKEIESLNEKIELSEVTEQELESLKEKIKSYEQDLEKVKIDADNSIEIANKEIKKLKNKIGNISEKYEAEAYARRSLVEFVDDIVVRYIDAIKLMDSLSEEIENQNNTIKGLKGDSDNIIISQGNDIKMLRQQIDKLVDEKENLEIQIVNTNESLDMIKQGYETQMSILREQVHFAESKYARLQQTAYVSDATQLAEQNKALEDVNITLRNQLKIKSGEVERGIREIVELNSTIKKLSDDKNNLSNTIKTITNGMQGGISQRTVIPKINYNGKNFIIPVFGSGSYGTTTTAMSLAHKFAERSNVLYIDFDLVSPKCDLWFKKSPLCIIPNSPDNGKDYSTSLGIFFEKGCRYFLDNYKHIVFNKLKSKDGSLDYLTGVYAKIEKYKFISADFSTFLTSLGNIYNYVIIDMGRLGSSELTDAIITEITRAVCEKDNRCVAVTTPNNIEVRNLRKKIMEVGIDISSIAWLVNMSKSNKIDEKVMKNIRPALASTMQFDPGLYGCVQTFQEENRSRDKALTQFIGNCIYASR